MKSKVPVAVIVFSLLLAAQPLASQTPRTPAVGETAEGAIPSLFAETGYEVFDLMEGATSRARILIDLSGQRKELKAGEKLLFDIRLFDPSSAEVPSEVKALAKGRDMLRFGLYVLESNGKGFHELPFDSPNRPAYLLLPSARKASDLARVPFFVYGTAPSKWSEFQPARGSGKSPDGFSASLRDIAAYHGLFDAVVEISAWPVGDPYAILPGGG